MARYQLFRTSPSISGQVRLDIMVNKDQKTQDISGDDIHIVPISDNIIFNESNKRPILNYSHLDNIKNLYREIGDDFYNTDGEYTENSWLFDPDNVKDPYSHTYMAGIKRMRYTRYNKQFSYMIPIWISEYTDFNKLRFVCHAGSDNRDVIMSSFKLSPDIIRYLQEYMDMSATGSYVSDNLINVDFDNRKSFIQGVQANVGQYMVRDTSYVMDFLLKRERPILEFDSILLDLFRQNNMIAQQILNLNFVFNIEDISGAWPEYYLYNKKIGIWIDVQYDNKSLEYKDLYTNYQYIPKYDLASGISTDDNILDYMSDYKCLDLVDANKFTQPVFHWALVDNPNYMFNLYSGCAPYVGNGLVMEGGSFDWVDISLNSADYWRRNWKWVKFEDRAGANWRSIYDDVISNGHPEYEYSEIINKPESLAIGSNLFRKFYDDNDRDAWRDLWNRIGDRKLWLAIVMDDDPDLPRYDFEFNTMDDLLGIVIVCRNLDDAVLYNICHSADLEYPEGSGTFIPGFLKYLFEATRNAATPDGQNPAKISTNDESLINELFSYIVGYHPGSDKSLWDRWMKPNMVELECSLDIYDDSKIMLNQKAEEFRYVVSDNPKYRYMYRYSGNLMPFFISTDNALYYNESFGYYRWDNDKVDIMRDCTVLKNKHIPMKYPSIVLGEAEMGTVTYYPWISRKDSELGNFYENWKMDILLDRKNIIWNLPPIIKFQVEMPGNYSPSRIDETILGGFLGALEELSGEGDCPLADAIREYPVEFNHFISENYTISNNFEYASLTDVDNIIYTVTYKLR